MEQVLASKGDEQRLFKVQESSQLADIHYTRQGDPLGLGHAILRAKSHVGEHSFAVLLGDDIIDARDPLLNRMLEIHQQTGDNVIALMEGSQPSKSPSTAALQLLPQIQTAS